VSATPEPARTRAILLDIEGTTTPIAFVTGVLFPYARKHLRSHLIDHAREPEYEAVFARLREEHQSALQSGEPVPTWIESSPDARLEAVAGFVEWLMDRDRKSTGLKELQGRIWEDGYRKGELVGEVFPDVAPALRGWHDRGLQAGIFSSGSVLGQQLLFRHSSAGDLTGLLRWHFDTHIGAKADADSYRRIASEAGMKADEVMFLSDITRELDAARDAGMQIRLVIRPGNAPVSNAQDYAVVRSLDEVL
jgi:enolase-phosphatase E1